jgi:4-aminobutyrate aminotransferase-like enzyme
MESVGRGFEMNESGGMVNAYVPGDATLSPDTEAMIVRRSRLLGPAYKLMYANPIHVVRGEGVWLYDAEGRAYLDVYNNVASVGHCHPRVLEAMISQSRTLCTNTRYLHETILDYSEKLLHHFPDELNHLMFTCTGSEANDLALRLAQSHTGGTGIIVTSTAYHGVTQAVSQISPSLGRHVNLGSHVRTIPSPVELKREHVDLERALEADVTKAIHDLQRHGIKPAALIFDSIFSSDGIIGDPPGFLSGAIKAIRAVGGLFIADEVQPGFGRTGDAMWGFQRHGCVPDMVSLGKPMGNGYPVAGLVVRAEIVAEFGRNARYFNTFGGNTVAAATASAVLDVIKSEGLQENARQVGSYFTARLQDLAHELPLLGDIRGAGLFIGVEIQAEADSPAIDTRIASQVVNAMRERGVLISATGPTGRVLKIRPPLVFSKENVDYFMDRFSDVVRKLEIDHSFG